MKPTNIPQDISAETLLGYYPLGTFAVKFRGLHKRNSYQDILDIEQEQGKMSLSIGRNSIYNSLPEYIFHSIDRFDNIPQHDKKEKFAEEYAKQEREKENAYKYFSPIDTLLLLLNVQVKETLRKYVESNIVIQDIILDNLSEEQKNNRFIKNTIPYITSCKTLRGNRTLLTLLLRKIFMDEGISICTKRKQTEFTDEHPKYDVSVDAPIGAVYVGNTFYETTMTYTVFYWSDENCDSDFPVFLQEIEIYRQFVQDYFLSVDSLLVFDITKDAPPLRISDTTIYNYLNFNTNI